MKYVRAFLGVFVISLAIVVLAVGCDNKPAPTPVTEEYAVDLANRILVYHGHYEPIEYFFLDEQLDPNNPTVIGQTFCLQDIKTREFITCPTIRFDSCILRSDIVDAAVTHEALHVVADIVYQEQIDHGPIWTSLMRSHGFSGKVGINAKEVCTK